jgi:hypothetical protein
MKNNASALLMAALNKKNGAASEKPAEVLPMISPGTKKFLKEDIAGFYVEWVNSIISTVNMDELPAKFSDYQSAIQEKITQRINNIQDDNLTIEDRESLNTQSSQIVNYIHSILNLKKEKEFPNKKDQANQKALDGKITTTANLINQVFADINSVISNIVERKAFTVGARTKQQDTLFYQISSDVQVELEGLDKANEELGEFEEEDIDRSSLEDLKKLRGKIEKLSPGNCEQYITSALNNNNIPLAFALTKKLSSEKDENEKASLWGEFLKNGLNAIYKISKDNDERSKFFKDNIDIVIENANSAALKDVLDIINMEENKGKPTYLSNKITTKLKTIPRNRSLPTLPISEDREIDKNELMNHCMQIYVLNKELKAHNKALNQDNLAQEIYKYYFIKGPFKQQMQHCHA